jgi:uncharacterized FlaG/YvyC family protein
MAVENTERINAQADPMEGQAYFVRKTEAAPSGDSVYSPAASVNDKRSEKARDISRGKADKAEPSADKASGGELGVTKSQLEEIAEGINKELTFFSNSIQFKLEEVEEDKLAERLPGSGSSGDDNNASVESTRKELVVSVIDKRTGEVIRRIPPDDLLQSLNNASMFVGLLVDRIV